MPFIKPSVVRGWLDAQEYESYGEAFAAALATADIDYDDRNVLVSHQFFTRPGVAPVRSESELNPVGGLDAIDVSIIQGFEYVALGHLHGAQSVGADHIRYAGSPLKYSFSEMRQVKSATIVELREKGSITIETLPLFPLHEMREIRGPLDKLLSSEAMSSADPEDYLRVILTDEEEIIDPMGKIRSLYPNVMSLDFENSRTQVDLSGNAASPDGAERLSPLDLFHAFFLEVNGSPMSSEQEKITESLLEAGVGE
jgi:exonuclease SbcD